ncbi:MAG: hypothetical protein GH143_08420 [Calditrichaeota bacterium]|nr:hypothetical protein [Calditrichota bacterium]
MNSDILSSNIITALVGIFGAIVGAVIVLFSVRLTARESRVSTIHEKMSACLIQTFDNIWEMMHLLDHVANRVYYRTVDTGEFKETAYDRYWRELDRLTEENRNLFSQQILYFPKDLVEVLKEINRLLNDARYEVKKVKPNDKHTYPNTSNVKSVIDKARPLLKSFREQARAYIGSDKLEPITPLEELPLLKALEEEQKKES